MEEKDEMRNPLGGCLTALIIDTLIAIAVLAIMATAKSCTSSAMAAESITEPPDWLVEMSEEIGQEYGICPELLQAIAFYESSYRPEAVNGSCTGLMQIDPKWHQDRMDKLGVTDLFDARSNLLVAADYLVELFDRYGDIATVLMIYHGEANATSKTEVSNYANKIMDMSAELERIHDK
jgi:soluble lytic murein transglycosylase-like protein